VSLGQGRTLEGVFQVIHPRIPVGNFALGGQEGQELLKGNRHHTIEPKKSQQNHKTARVAKP